MLIICADHKSFARKALNHRRTHQEEPKNNILFERHVFELFDKKLFSLFYTEFRPVARNVLRVNITTVLTGALTDFWGRGTLYKKYNTYQKYLIDVRDDFCEFFKLGDSTKPLTKILLDNFGRLLHFDYQFHCPFGPGLLTGWSKGVNFSDINVPLMPAGRYRFDLLFTKKDERHKYFKFEMYFAISDIRVWF